MVLYGEEVIILRKHRKGRVCPPESTLRDGKGRPDAHKFNPENHHFSFLHLTESFQNMTSAARGFSYS